MKKVGIVGCGDISGIYIKNILNLFSDRLLVAGLYNSTIERAQKRAAEFGGLKVYPSYDAMLGDSDVDIILNLTRPLSHFEISESALKAGKHVYSEKPLAATAAQAKTLIAAASDKGLVIGCAPDTFLGSGAQTCRQLLESGAIGDVIGCSAFMLNKGAESWHPNPEFFYKKGAGPMLDVGVYYITTLVYLLGPVTSVAGIAKTPHAERVITFKPKRGQIIKVETPTYITGVMEFESGAAGTLIMSFDAAGHGFCPIEIYGTLGTLRVPDPNTFGGRVTLFTNKKNCFKEQPLLPGFSDNARGLGLYEMAGFIESGEPFRACAALAYHTLEVMEGFERAYADKKYAVIKSRV